MTLDWNCKKFHELTPDELYAIFRLRSEVFVVEQNCIYLDFDNKDQESWHVTGWNEGKLVAYTRLLPAGLAFEEPSIGRVCTSPSARKSGVGRELMNYSMMKALELFGKTSLRIGAQLYLKSFYESLGFNQSSDVYLEDGIKHIEMVFPFLEN